MQFCPELKSLGFEAAGIYFFLVLEGPSEKAAIDAILKGDSEMALLALIGSEFIYKDGDKYAVSKESSMPPLEGLFDAARKRYRQVFNVPVRGLTPELEHFKTVCKKKKLDPEETARLLLPAIEAQGHHYATVRANGGFVPTTHKYFQGWITEQRWTMEVEEPVAVTPEYQQYIGKCKGKGLSPLLGQSMVHEWIEMKGPFAGIDKHMGPQTRINFFWRAHEAQNPYEQLKKWK